MDGLATKVKRVYQQQQQQQKQQQHQHHVPTAADVIEQASRTTTAHLNDGTPAMLTTSQITTTIGTIASTAPPQTKNQINPYADNKELIRLHHMTMYDASPRKQITQASTSGATSTNPTNPSNPLANANPAQAPQRISNVNTATQWLQTKLSDTQQQQHQHQRISKSPAVMAAHSYSPQTQQQIYNNNNNSTTTSSNNNNNINNSNYLIKHYKNISLEHLAGLHAKAKIRNKNEEAINDLLERIPDIERTFDVLSRIGNGTFSTVLLATLKKERTLPESMRRKFAIKHHIPTSHPDRIMKELQCMTKMGGTDNVVGINCCIRCDASVAFIMPYMAHDRFHDFYTKMKPDEVKFYMRNLLQALRHVHRFDIIHRDVKPSNFLYNRRNRQFLLVDFGLAQHVPTPAADVIAARVAQMQQTQPMAASMAEQQTVGTGAAVGQGTHKRGRDQDDLRQQQQQTPSTTSTSLDIAGSAKRIRFNGNVEGVTMPTAMAASTTTSTTTTTMAASYTANATQKLPLKQTNELTAKVSETPTEHGKTTAHDANKLPATNEPHTTVAVDAPTTKEQANIAAKYSSNRNNMNSNNNNNSNSSNNNKCYCYGHPHVCNVCLIKKEVHASRAGTPGYRPPEVLLKYPDQTTAVDVWAAGVIFLSILSSVYPFFKAPSDYIALAEIVTIFGDKTIRKTAFSLDRLVTLSQRAQPLDLHKLCVRFRNRLLFSATDMLQKYQKPDGSCDVCKNCDQYYFNCLCLESQYNTEPVDVYDIFPPSAYDLLLRLLEVNPHKRITAEEALKHPFLSESNEPHAATVEQHHTSTTITATTLNVGYKSSKRPRSAPKANANCSGNVGGLTDSHCAATGDATAKRLFN